MPQGVAAAKARTWLGRDLQVEGSWITTLTEKQRQCLTVRFQELEGRPLLSIERSDAHIPELDPAIAASMESLTAANGWGFAILRGLPVLDNEADMIKLFWLVAQHIGTPVTQSNLADLVGNVRHEAGASERRGYKSSGGMDFHSDFTPLAGLLCWKQAISGGESRLLSTSTIHDLMLHERPDLLPLCYDDVPYGRPGENRADEPAFSTQPIFTNGPDGFGGFFSRKLIRWAIEDGVAPISKSQEEAVDFLEEITQRSSLEFLYLLQPGDLLLLNNYRVLHGRSEFVDDDDPDRRRHLFRIWLETFPAWGGPPPSVLYDYHYGNIGLTPHEVLQRGL
jgi:hypothetical protein